MAHAELTPGFHISSLILSLLTFSQPLPFTVFFSFSLFVITFYFLFIISIEGILMRIHFFTAVFPAIDRWFEVAVVETSHQFLEFMSALPFLLVMYIQRSLTFLISFFLIDQCFVFQLSKKKQDFSNSCFQKFEFNERN